MQALAIGRWRLEHDPVATRAVYEASSRGAHDCSCAYCRNFIAVRDHVYPPSFLELLSQLGIDPHKEAEICDYAAESGGRLTGGWYHFIGRVLEDPGDQYAFDHDGRQWSMFFSSERGLAFPEFGDRPLVQLDWTVIVPWVLDEVPGN